MKYAHTITFVVLLLVTIIGTGCSSPCNPADIEAFLKPYEADVTAKNYILQPPDDIAVHCSKVPEIDMQVQRIRPDGKVSFEGLGEFVVAGKTPSQVAEVLGKKVEELYKLVGEFPIEVRVVDYRSKVFYVMGQVFSPGVQIHTGRETVLLSVAEAVPNPMAATSKIRVIRPSADPGIRAKAFKVNFKRMITHGETSQDVLLQEGDIVYVPPTFLAKIGLKLEELIRPVARAFSGAYMLQNPPTSRKGSSSAGRNDYRY